MKKNIFFIVLLGMAQLAGAQGVVKSSELINNKLQTGYTLLVRTEEKFIRAEWKEYAGIFGKVEEPKRGEFVISRFREKSVSNDDIQLMSKVSGLRNYAKVFIYSNDRVNDRGMAMLLEDFAAKSARNELVRMATQELDEARSVLADAQKALKKLERNAASNVEEQEKYGKILQELPTKTESLVAQKDTLVMRSMMADSATAAAFEKESKRKEKELLTVKRDEERATKRLSKREEEFKKLQEDIVATKSYIKELEAVVADRERAVREIQK